MRRQPASSRALIVAILLFGTICLAAQSSSQEFPTAVLSNEIVGSIKARDVGDSRLTAHFYTFNSETGDLFINIVTRNFTGDIDLFAFQGLRPLTKIVVYADSTEQETGRAIYLRKPEKVILRIQGRTPNDDDASYKLKFAGSFVAARAEDTPSAPDVPRVVADTRGNVRVNSVGTILPPPPKQVDTEPERTIEKAASTETPVANVGKAGVSQSIEPLTKPNDSERKVELVVTDPVKEKMETADSTAARASNPRRRPARRTPAERRAESPPVRSEENSPAPKEPPPAEAGKAPAAVAKRTPRRQPVKKADPPAPDPLASVSLVIQFKNGNVLEKKMSEVFRFSVDKGVLTVILKDGKIAKYPVVDISKLTIEPADP